MSKKLSKCCANHIRLAAGRDGNRWHVVCIPAEAVVGLDAEARMYLLDLWRRRAAADAWVAAYRFSDALAYVAAISPRSPHKRSVTNDLQRSSPKR
jgi:hypothetical protein